MGNHFGTVPQSIRKVHFNNPDLNGQYINNKISNTKYTLITFIPKNLWYSTQGFSSEPVQVTVWDVYERLLFGDRLFAVDSSFGSCVSKFAFSSSSFSSSSYSSLSFPSFRRSSTSHNLGPIDFYFFNLGSQRSPRRLVTCQG